MDRQRVMSLRVVPVPKGSSEPQRRRLAYVEVELGTCQHCGRDAGAHSSDGRCAPVRDRLGRRRRPRSYRGRKAFAFIDLDAPEYQAAVPDSETIELFRNNAAGQVGL